MRVRWTRRFALLIEMTCESDPSKTSLMGIARGGPSPLASASQLCGSVSRQPRRRRVARA